MPVEVPQVLQLQGGSPLLKAGASFVEKLKHAKALDGGDMSSLMPKLMSGGLGSIMQNPMAAITGQLQGVLGQASTQIGSFTQLVAQVTSSGASGGGSSGGSGSGSSVSGSGSSGSGTGDTSTTTLVSTPSFPLTLAALQGTSGLQAMTSTFAQTTAGLSGVGAAPSGGYGLLDLITHAGSLNIFGDDVPTQYSVATAASPLTSETLIGGTDDAVNAIVAAIAAFMQPPSGVVPDAATIAAMDASQAVAVQALTGALQAVLTASSAAFSGFRALLPVLATAAAVCGALAMATSSYDAGDPQWAALLPTLVQPDALALLRQANIDMLAVPSDGT